MNRRERKEKSLGTGEEAREMRPRLLMHGKNGEDLEVQAAPWSPDCHTDYMYT